MSVWYIGIDETGSFNHLDLDDNSNVCAAITRKSPKELFSIFHNVAKDFYKVRPTLTKSWKKMSPSDKNVILGKFHGCEQGNSKFEALDALLEQDEQLIDCVIQSKGRPFVTVNPQQWWIAAVIGVVQKFFSMGKCEKKDQVHIEIATRDFGSLGLRSKPNPIIYYKYNSLIAANIEEELKLALKKSGLSIKVSLQPAGYRELPTLGDQVSNIIKPDYQAHADKKFKKDLLERITPIETPPLSISLGDKVQDLIEKDNLQRATEALLSEVLNNDYSNIELLDTIVDKAKEKPESQHIWQTIITACEIAQRNRGTDGEALNRAGEIITRLSRRYADIPNENVKNKFLHLHAQYMGNAGKWDNELFEKIEESFKQSDSSFSNPLKRWNYFLNIFSDKAQTYFNVYKFGELENDYKYVLQIQNQIEAIQLPFDVGERDPDQNFSIIYGTIGQDYAFEKKYEKAIEYLKKSFYKSPDFFKSMSASFLSTVYFKQRNLSKAQEWHEIQCKYTENQADQWLILDKLRIGALAMEQGKSFDIPPIQNWHNEGDYPWPLLLKWSAYIGYRKNDKRAFKQLEQAYNKLIKSPGFTIRTLALSVIAMQIFIAQDGNEDEAKKLEQYQNNYKELLKKCEDERSSFSCYVQKHEEFYKAAQKADSLWDAANLLPFNFA